jgi:hypothetical protein
MFIAARGCFTVHKLASLCFYATGKRPSVLETALTLSHDWERHFAENQIDYKEHHD